MVKGWKYDVSARGVCLTDCVWKKEPGRQPRLIPSATTGSVVLPSAISVTCSQPWCKNINWKIPEIRSFEAQTLLRSMMKSHGSVHMRWEPSLCPACSCCICYQSFWWPSRLPQYQRAYVQVTLMLLNNSSKVQEWWCWPFGYSLTVPDS